MAYFGTEVVRMPLDQIGVDFGDYYAPVPERYKLLKIILHVPSKQGNSYPALQHEYDKQIEL